MLDADKQVPSVKVVIGSPVKVDPTVLHGDGGLGAVFVRTAEGEGKVFIEYAFEKREELVATLKELLKMAHVCMPGVAQNAVVEYLKETGQIDASGKNAHIQYKHEKQTTCNHPRGKLLANGEGGLICAMCRTKWVTTELLARKERYTAIRILSDLSTKPLCTEYRPCGCHFGEVFHADNKCFCDLLNDYLTQKP